MSVRRKRVQLLVDDLLMANNVRQPPVPVEKILKSQDILIRKDKDANVDISGFIFRRGSEVVVGVNASNALPRQRFTIAHELGHFLLHTRQQMDTLHVDRSFEVKFRDELSSEGTDEEEREANLFAAELLMPRQFLAEDLAVGSLDHEDDAIVQTLARRYGVSVQAMTFRLANLGYLSL